MQPTTISTSRALACTRSRRLLLPVLASLFASALVLENAIISERHSRPLTSLLASIGLRSERQYSVTGADLSIISDADEEYADLARPGKPRSYGCSGMEQLTGKDIVYEDLQVVDLRYFQGIRCQGPPCPAMAQCTDGLPETATRVAACSYEYAVDSQNISTPLPENYGGNNVSYDLQVGEQFSGQVFVLENVFLNDRGMVLDRNHIYTFDHFCKSAPLDFFKYEANQTYVYAYKEAASIAYWNGGNFYHSLLETLPALLLLKPFLDLRPGLPVAIRSSQQEYLHMNEIIGFEPSDLNGRVVPDQSLFFVERLLLPAMPRCGRPSKALIGRLRETYIFPDASTLRGKQGAEEGGDGNWGVVPDDWVIVIGHRAKSRQIEGRDELLKKLLEFLPRNRTVIFDGGLTLREERAVFQRARLFISPHGALLANIFFMPWYGEVLEIRPDQFDNGVYNFVAHICGVRYNLLYGNGTKDTHIFIDHKVVIKTVRMIVKAYLPSKQEKGPKPPLLGKRLEAVKGLIGVEEDTALAIDAVPEIKNDREKMQKRTKVVKDATNAEKHTVALTPKIPKQDGRAPPPLRK